MSTCLDPPPLWVMLAVNEENVACVAEYKELPRVSRNVSCFTYLKTLEDFLHKCNLVIHM